MRILFIHRNFPGQFLYLVTFLSRQTNVEVVFITQRQDNHIPNVRKVIYQTPSDPSHHSHHYLREYHDWIAHGQGVAQAAQQLKREGFVPDIIYAHAWGGELFIKDVYPDIPLLCYFEWYTNPQGSDLDFDPSNRLSLDNHHEIRIKNSPKLVSLTACDHAITPTQWQFRQFPSLFHNKFSVIHDGVCANFYHPNPDAKLVIPHLELDLSGIEEIVTYATSGMEPYRGFPQFMEAASITLERRPNCHIVIAGNDASFYSHKRPDGKTHKEYLLETLDLDPRRLHFVGYLSLPEYAKFLQASKVHIYLTYPYILSWSLIEAMASGCLIIASDTAPVREVIKDGENGYLVDFFSPPALADKINYCLDQQASSGWRLRGNARKTILDNYDVQRLMAQTLKLISELSNRKQPFTPST